MFQAPLWLAVPFSLLRGQFIKSIALLAVIGCISYGAVLTRNYFLQCRDNLIKNNREVADNDQRQLAMGFVALGVFCLVVIITRRSPLIGVFSAALAAVGYYLNYIIGAWQEPTEGIAPPPEPETLDHLTPTQREMLSNAQDYLRRMQRIGEHLRDDENGIYLAMRLKQIARRGQQLLTEITPSAEKIRKVRTLLVIHLREAATIGEQFTLLASEKRLQSRQQFSALLDTILNEVNQKHDVLSDAQQRRLDIHMQVLQDQLKESKHHE
ncbi:5-bromo-4-chloroindolyl phosphate hydrolysis family protein [Suttonella sp. R2A3]|uniref:5-bromo-4-chloroindolyl phosphate hydrolysis family protein n=1 Tax=Suttonella sp. R2A3 TaxID=2908648 RepID=UPI001F2CAC01|nr:5-bromo-4-chloroindolyl phosphate hydrolysis family protein [Suttonella sp. R2A3]UJF24712.1 5-bromo-4-chloroindolyl phosphate hydrolysis family protein [Suttonella sp. R2A3]